MPRPNQLSRKGSGLRTSEHLGFLGKSSVVKNIFILPTYMTSIIPPICRRAFLARLHVLPSNLLEGRFQGIPYSDRLCPCDSGKVEIVEHVLLYCHFYWDLCKDLLSHIFLKFPGRSNEFYILLILSDKVSYVSSKVPKYRAAAIACCSVLTT